MPRKSAIAIASRAVEAENGVPDKDLLASRTGTTTMSRILVSGSTGLVGSAVMSALEKEGHDMVRLVRPNTTMNGVDRLSANGKSAINWDPGKGEVDVAELEGLDGVVHLAGDNIASGRWTDSKKESIRYSRVIGTRFLCDQLEKLERPPKVLVCASAIGYYGDRGDEVMTEESPPAEDFLAEVCREWEAACKPAIRKGIRVVNLRIGVVLSPKGGGLHKMLLPFKMGVGGVVGSGRQYWSWIALDDLVKVISFALHDEKISGPVNAVSPNSLTNREFTTTLGKVLRRPTIAPLPAFAARMMMGRELADAILLSSTRVQPAKLQAAGFRFNYADLETALRHLLGRN